MLYRRRYVIAIHPGQPLSHQVDFFSSQPFSASKTTLGWDVKAGDYYFFILFWAAWWRIMEFPFMLLGRGLSSGVWRFHVVLFKPTISLFGFRMRCESYCIHNALIVANGSRALKFLTWSYH